MDINCKRDGSPSFECICPPRSNFHAHPEWRIFSSRFRFTIAAAARLAACVLMRFVCGDARGLKSLFSVRAAAKNKPKPDLVAGEGAGKRPRMGKLHQRYVNGPLVTGRHPAHEAAGWKPPRRPPCGHQPRSEAARRTLCARPGTSPAASFLRRRPPDAALSITAARWGLAAADHTFLWPSAD